MGGNTQIVMRIKDKPNKYPKRIRLKDFPYQGCHHYFITLRCHNQAGHFTNGNFVVETLAILKNTAMQKNFYGWAYCFMPNHLHLLVEGKTEAADMRGFISVFKQKAAFRFKRRYGTRLWQPNYYERVLRKDETTAAVARYIIENPVRKGLAKDYAQYPFSGSVEVSDISQIL